MDKILNKEILRLSIPSILANLTVPLVGFVDTAVAGHLQGGEGAAAFIGAISIGSMLFNLLYWNFGFLRTGTGGLTAQAFGRGDMHGSAVIFFRGIALAMAAALFNLLIQWPFVKIALALVNGGAEVESLAAQYFFIRIWAAPATLSLMAFSGWFVGMQDSMSSMWKDLVVNGVNVAASIMLALGIGSWEGLGFAGVAWGTVIAQYSGLAYCIVKTVVKYGRKVFAGFRLSELKEVFTGAELRSFFKMNADLVLRSIGFTGIYIGYTAIAATFGDVLLACSSIMMQILMIFSYFTDGFAYAGEALAGRYIGARDKTMLRRSVNYVFVWSMSIAFAFTGVYLAAGEPIVRLLTSDSTVVDTCALFIPWLALMPLFGCCAFTWDGVYLGATASVGLRNSMLGAMFAFFAVWFVGDAVLHPAGNMLMHVLLAAYFAHLLFRSVYLSLMYRKEVLLKI